MKKFWKIRIDNNLRQKMEYLKVSKNYIEILLDDYSEFMDYVNYPDEFKFVIISLNGIHHKYSHNYDYNWSWGGEGDYNWYIEKGYKYCGEINLRKYKLKKLNAGFLENKK